MANHSSHVPKVTFFEMREESEAFMSSFTNLLQQLIRQKTGERVPVENHQRYSHGRTWRHPANEHASNVEMHTLGAEGITTFEDILGNDFSIVPRMLESIVQQFDEAHARMVYSTISEVCEASGQTVDARDKSVAEAFIEAFRKIEFGVDRDGNPSLPVIHVGSMDVVEQLQMMDEAYKAEFEHLKQEKMDHARAAEAERRNRFKRTKS